MPKMPEILTMLAGQGLPWQHQAMMLHDLLGNINPQTEAVVKYICECIGKQSGDALAQEKVQQYNNLIKEVQEGPLRPAYFLQKLNLHGNNVCQAEVMLDDGTLLYPVISDENLARTLTRGDRVVVDGKGRLVLFRAPGHFKMGETAVLERMVDDIYLDVTVQGGHDLLLASDELAKGIKDGKVVPGQYVIYNARNKVAFGAMPAEDGVGRLKFLDLGPVPDILVERDIGCPPACIEELTEHFRSEMTQPELRRQFKTRSSTMKMLVGVSGSGKTLAVQAIHRRMYEVISEITSTAIDKLPRRVFRFRPGKLLSMWLGESDKNLEKIFDEIEFLAGQPFVNEQGESFQLPVLVIIEEADGLTRARGTDHEGVYDRLLVTILQRLDPAREELKGKIVVFVSTSNEVQICDPAFVRRAGASMEVFGRLDRTGFQAVLKKHLAGLPIASNNGYTNEQLYKRLVTSVTTWLFSPKSLEPGVVELTYAGQTTPVIKHKRDFITGALIDRAVQQAATEACQLAIQGQPSIGVTLEQLMRAFNQQILGIVAQLREQNVGNYTDLPDGVRVATLRRIPQPSHLPIELQTN